MRNRIASSLLIGCVAAAAVGACAGVLGRLLMRLFTVAGDGVPSFTLAGTFLIVLLFVVAVIPGGIASAAGKNRRLTSALYVVASLPVVWNGFAIGWQEWSAAATRGLDVTEVFVLVLVTAAIAAVVLFNPFLTHRLSMWLSRHRPAGGSRAKERYETA